MIKIYVFDKMIKILNILLLYSYFMVPSYARYVFDGM
jgi:hypothetical protein